MPKAALTTVVRYCDKLLRTRQFTDWDAAFNGLQVENSGAVTRIAAAVDGSLATVKMAIAAKADLLLVHHGLFWGPTQPWTGRRYELQRLLIGNNLAVYSSHLPLDAHPQLGNNAQLASQLGFRNLKPFFLAKGQFIGFQVKTRIARDELRLRLNKTLGTNATVLPGGRPQCERIGIVSGGCGAELKQAADEGVDTVITGEGPHWTYALAEELGLNVFYGGHYATETFGVKALAQHLSKKFRLPWVFINHPTGL